jgi:hypothetical protein
LTQLRQHSREFESHATNVAVVTFDSAVIARGYADRTGMLWPLLLDNERQLYRAYGMEQGGMWDVWGWSSWKTYAKLLWKGRRLQRPTGDTRQLGGDVIVDPTGIVRLQWIGSGPADRPSVEFLLEVIRTAN